MPNVRHLPCAPEPDGRPSAPIATPKDRQGEDSQVAFIPSHDFKSGSMFWYMINDPQSARRQVIERRLPILTTTEEAYVRRSVDRDT